MKKDSSEDAGGGKGLSVDGLDCETLAAGVRSTPDTEGNQGFKALKFQGVEAARGFGGIGSGRCCG